jgi:hypothetical protein
VQPGPEGRLVTVSLTAAVGGERTALMATADFLLPS